MIERDPNLVTIRTPISVMGFRCACLGLITYFVHALWASHSWISTTGIVVYLLIVLTSLGSAIVSFVQSTWALRTVIGFVIGMPLAFWLALDIFELRGAWWEWAIVFPFVQMAFPLLFA